MNPFRKSQVLDQPFSGSEEGGVGGYQQFAPGDIVEIVAGEDFRNRTGWDYARAVAELGDEGSSRGMPAPWRKTDRH